MSVVVLGDVGRSPRMQYHALALAVNQAEVDLVGLAGTPPHPSVAAHPRVRCHALAASRGESPAAQAHPRFIARALARVARQAMSLGALLVRLPRPDIILVQSPPAIPALAVALCAARIRNARLIVDWHNLGSSLLALRLGPRHLLVRFAAGYERVLGRRADAHLCVSQAMRRELVDRWRLDEVRVLHDRPPPFFQPLEADARDEAARAVLRRVGIETNPRPALVMAPTSWTIDEDFDLLLDALERCEARLHRPHPRGPRIVLLVTGEGPRRAEYEERLARRAGAAVEVRTTWLEAEEYPRALAAADLGLCLHRSASGLDLPMKLADMEGAGIPTCVLQYGAVLAERLDEAGPAVRFSSGAELGDLLSDLFARFPDDTGRLDHLRGASRAARGSSWIDGWMSEARPLFSAPR